MITRPAAIALVTQHLGDGFRARHSLFVGHVMKRFALELGEDIALWEITGICHDLDFEVTKEDRSKHGVIAAEWLRNDLPEAALLAIRSHDHRTGVESETPLADALKLGDALAVAEMDIGRESLVLALNSNSPEIALNELLTPRPYLPSLILVPAARIGVPLFRLGEICASAPIQCC